MYFRAHLLATLSALEIVVATPVALPQSNGGGADSCRSEPLTEETWTTLKVDDFLQSAGSNLTTNNLTKQSRYALVAIQNYNSYMNSLNTAVSFAASIMALEMPAVINDIWPSPEDNATPLKEVYSMITLGLSVVPFTGAMAKAAAVPKGVVSFLSGQVKPPVPPNLFVKWSDLGVSISSAVKDYQSAISTSLKSTLNSEIHNETTGINSVLAGGGFLGIAQNFTQADMQANIADSMKLRSIALALQGRKAFIYRGYQGCFNSNNDASKFCATVDGKEVQYALRMGDDEQIDIAAKLIDKYGISKETFLQGPSTCFEEHKVQLFTPEFLPVDPKAPCIFNLPVCTFDPDTFPGRTIVENCRLQGLDV
ncbi:hypothetical protein BGZ61DRAFT_489882 [Ilyonectria robusta]|uniref:uncharacterized protein n=1 Tax=Ilyonectria robusta TaxID=1079257 RepID=UPI001E8D9175|nr:uncharacterized protein BGZ61DRAFT_489882 [Ilyonectria robusta]KAH8736119.1 hypothetical protein BGZ61DRAFT_489882 [Ilyonectria robusta]